MNNPITTYQLITCKRNELLAHGYSIEPLVIHTILDS